MKKIIALILSIMLIIVAAIPAAAITTKPAAKVKVTKIKMNVYASWVKPGLEAVVKKINDNPATYGVKIEYDRIPDSVSQGLQLLKVRYASGLQPDLQYFASAKSAKTEFGKNAKFADLSGSWTSQYNDETIKSDFFTYDGKVIAAPLGPINVGAMLYNKKVFSNLGISVPTTWTAFLAACEKIKAAGKTPIYISGSEDWTVQLWPMLAFMREFAAVKSSSMMENLNTNKDTYASKKLFIEGNKLQLDLKTKGYFNSTMMSDTYAAAQKALVDGTAGMYCMGTWVVDEIKAAYPDKVSDIGAFAIPFDGNDPLPLWMPWTMLVPEKGKNIDLSKKVVLAFASNEFQQAFFNAQAGIPLAKGLDMSKIKLADAQKEAYAIFTTPGRGYTEFGNLAFYGQGDNFSRNNQELLLGTKTADQVAEGIDKDVAMKAKAARDPNWK